jgi:hypothetical protein
MNKITRTLTTLTLPALLLSATATLHAAEQAQVTDEAMKCPMMEPGKNMTAAEKEKFLQQCKEHCKEMQEKHTTSGTGTCRFQPEKSSQLSYCILAQIRSYLPNMA